MDNMCEDNLTYGVSELAKRSNISVSLSGWPAAFAIMLIPLSVVAKRISISRDSISPEIIQ